LPLLSCPISLPPRRFFCLFDFRPLSQYPKKTIVESLLSAVESLASLITKVLFFPKGACGRAPYASPVIVRFEFYKFFSRSDNRSGPPFFLSPPPLTLMSISFTKYKHPPPPPPPTPPTEIGTDHPFFFASFRPLFFCTLS